MKKPIFAVVILALTIFSCSVDQLDTTSHLTEYLLIEDSQRDSRSASSKINLEEDVCNRVLLMSDNNLEIGVVDFSIINSQIVITYKTIDGWNLLNTNLSLKDASTESFPMTVNGQPMIDQFEYSESHGKGVNEFTYSIDQNDFADTYNFAAFALVVGPKDKHEAWGMGDKFTENGIAMYSVVNAENCGVRSCHDANDVEFYIPLKSESSGIYPHSGSNSDSVAITEDSPISEGSLEVELNFTKISKYFGNAEITIDFNDLDLHPDAISADGNNATFSETFTLRDKNREILAVLDETHNEDGNFTWTFSLPNELFDASELILFVTLESSLELTNGEGLQVSNTIESMMNISICGYTPGIIEE